MAERRGLSLPSSSPSQVGAAWRSCAWPAPCRLALSIVTSPRTLGRPRISADEADAAGGVDDLATARLVERHALGEALGAGPMLDLTGQQDLAARLAGGRALDPVEIAIDLGDVGVAVGERRGVDRQARHGV